MLKYQRNIFRLFDSILIICVVLAQISVLVMMFGFITEMLINDRGFANYIHQFYQVGIMAVFVCIANALCIFMTKVALTINHKDTN